MLINLVGLLSLAQAFIQIEKCIFFCLCPGSGAVDVGLFRVLGLVLAAAVGLVELLQVLRQACKLFLLRAK